MGAGAACSEGDCSEVGRGGAGVGDGLFFLVQLWELMMRLGRGEEKDGEQGGWLGWNAWFWS